MSQPKIVVYCGRFAHSVPTSDAIDNCILCVSEASQSGYEEMNPGCEVVAYPNELAGDTLSSRLQWMFDHFGDVFLLGDSVYAAIRMYETKGEEILLTPREAYRAVLNCYEMAQDAGAKLYGFNQQSDPRRYHGNQPIRLTGVCNINGMGLIREGSKLWFNKKVDLYPDLWISLLNAHQHRFAVFDDRFSFTCRGETPELSEAETKPEFLLLQKFFGGAVKPKKIRTGPGKKNWNRWQPRVSLPF